MLTAYKINAEVSMLGFKKISFRSHSKDCNSVPAEDLSRFYKVVSFCSFNFLLLFFFFSEKQQTKGSRGYKGSHHQLLLGF